MSFSGATRGRAARIAWRLGTRAGLGSRSRNGSTGPLRRYCRRQEPDEERIKICEAPTFKVLVETYRASPTWRKKAESTRDVDEGRLNAFLLPALGQRKVVDITLGELRKLHRDLCDPEKAEALARSGGATKNTRRGGEGGARRTMRLLKAILGFAVEEFDLSENPAGKLKLGSDGERDAVPDSSSYDRMWAAIEKLRGTSTPCSVHATASA